MLRSVILMMLMLAVLTSGRMRGRLSGGFGALSTDFSCDGLPYGYYADVGNNCRAYHVCEPIFNEETGELEEVAHYSFMCGSNAIFSQDILSCAHRREAFSCADAPSIYASSNAEVGVIPEVQADAVIQ